MPCARMVFLNYSSVAALDMRDYLPLAVLVGPLASDDAAFL